MSSRLHGALLFCALALAACGGGGGGGTPSDGFAIFQLTVPGQASSPLGPFGSTAGGDEVRIDGAQFVPGVSVFFGGVASVQVTVVSAGELRAITPPHAEGVVDVSLASPGGGSAALAAAFRYVAPPVVLGVVALDGPTAGESRAPIAGGTTLEISGGNFKAGAQASIAGVSLPTTFLDATRVRCAAPPFSGDGSVDVQVRNPEGLRGTLGGGLTYTQEFSLLAETAPFNARAARHLLRRAGFGAPQEVVDRAVGEGLTATVDRLLDFAPNAQVEADALALYAPNFPPSELIPGRTNQDYWLHLLVHNPNPLQERLAFLFHDHFAISQRNFDGGVLWWMHDQVRLLRRFAARAADGGLEYDWRKLLVEQCKDKAMLLWLDGVISTNRAPNENFAREFWELFTLGEGIGYTQQDIVEASRAFTGFRVVNAGGANYQTVQYVPSRHDAGTKTIFGETGRFGYDSVSPYHASGTNVEVDAADTEGMVSLTLRKRPVEASRFVCRKLAAFFLYDDPHDVVVDELAADLRNANWNLKPVVRKILRSKAMFSSRGYKAKVKSPVEFVVGFLRSTGIRLPASQLRGPLAAMGQVVLDPPDVNGWEEGTAWMASQSMLERINFLETAISTLVDVPTTVEPLCPPPGQRSPTQLVDHVARILDVSLSGVAHAEAVEYVTTQLDASGNRVPSFVFDPANPAHLRMKVRGLLYTIGQHHDAHRQ